MAVVACSFWLSFGEKVLDRSAVASSVSMVFARSLGSLVRQLIVIAEMVVAACAAPACQQGGLPDSAESAELAAVEDLVAARVLTGAVGVHAMTLTAGVMKERVFSMPAGRDIARLHSELRKEISTHDLRAWPSRNPLGFISRIRLARTQHVRGTLVADELGATARGGGSGEWDCASREFHPCIFLARTFSSTDSGEALRWYAAALAIVPAAFGDDDQEFLEGRDCVLSH